MRRQHGDLGNEVAGFCSGLFGIETITPFPLLFPTQQHPPVSRQAVVKLQELGWSGHHQVFCAWESTLSNSLFPHNTYHNNHSLLHRNRQSGGKENRTSASNPTPDFWRYSSSLSTAALCCENHTWYDIIGRIQQFALQIHQSSPHPS